MDLERLKYRKIVKEKNMLVIHNERHNDDDCKMLEVMDAFKTMDDSGQPRINCKMRTK